MPTQRYSNKTVLDAARERIGFIFDNFENVIVSVSGGKDSTVLAHLALLEARARDRRIGLHFLDEEVVFQSSVEQVEYLMNLFPENTAKLWLQVEFNLTNSCSLTEGQLRCWEPGKHALWMRSKREDAIKAPPWDRKGQTIRNGNKGFGFRDAIDNFARCRPGSAFLVGFRAAGESPNRWRAVTKNPVNISGQKIYWATAGRWTTTLYPIYDWNFHDVWKYIHGNRIRYSRVYDWQFKKGYPPSQMRVSSLIHEHSFKHIADLPEFEPKTYAKLLKRVKGVSLVQETGKAAKLFACRKLPKNFRSWIVYRDFLLQTHPDPKARDIMASRFVRHLVNEYVARQQCRQLILGDYENCLPVDNQPDPRDGQIARYEAEL